MSFVRSKHKNNIALLDILDYILSIGRDLLLSFCFFYYFMSSVIKLGKKRSVSDIKLYRSHCMFYIDGSALLLLYSWPKNKYFFSLDKYSRNALFSRYFNFYMPSICFFLDLKIRILFLFSTLIILCLWILKDFDMFIYIGI